MFCADECHFVQYKPPAWKGARGVMNGDRPLYLRETVARDDGWWRANKPRLERFHEVWRAIGERERASFANAMGGRGGLAGRHNRERRRRVSAGIRRVSDTAAFVERARARARALRNERGYRATSRFLEISHCVGFLTGRLLEPFALEGTVTIRLRGAAATPSSRAACRGRTRRVATMEAYRRAFIATGSFEPVKHVMVRAPPADSRRIRCIATFHPINP